MSYTIKTNTGVWPVICAGTYHGPWEYESLFGSEIESLEEEGDYICDDFDTDAFHEVMLHCLEQTLAEWAPLADDGVLSIKCPKLDSPKYYNFRDDEAYLDVEVDDGFFEKALAKITAEENRETVKKYIHDNWHGRDGFISLMPETLEEYLFDMRRLLAGEKTEVSRELVEGGTLALLWAIHLKYEGLEDPYVYMDYGTPTMDAVEKFLGNHSISEFATVCKPEEVAAQKGLKWIDFRLEAAYVDKQTNDYCALWPNGDERRKRALDWRRKAIGAIGRFEERQKELVVSPNTDASDMEDFKEEWGAAKDNLVAW